MNRRVLAASARRLRLGEIGDDFAVVPEQFVADGDTVVALGRYGWKHKSSGELAVVKMVHVWTMEGKAVAFSPVSSWTRTATGHL